MLDSVGSFSKRFSCPFRTKGLDNAFCFFEMALSFLEDCFSEISFEWGVSWGFKFERFSFEFPSFTCDLLINFVLFLSFVKAVRSFCIILFFDDSRDKDSFFF